MLTTDVVTMCSADVTLPCEFCKKLYVAKKLLDHQVCLSIIFLRAKAALLFSARLSHRNCVRLSVCQSVCLSHGWVSQKWCMLGSPNLHRRLPRRL